MPQPKLPPRYARAPRVVRYIGALLALVLLGVFGPGLGLSYIGHSLDALPEVAPADAIVVLSGGGPERLAQGIALFKRGLAPQLWYTGDAPTSSLSTFTDAEFARQYAVKQGVREAAIHLLSTTSTWEDGQEIAARAKQTGVHSILLVTDWYHGRRALCSVKAQLAGTGTAAYYSPSIDLSYRADNWWQSENGQVAVINELIKSAFYRVKYGLTPWQCDQLAQGALASSTAGPPDPKAVLPLLWQWAILGVLAEALSYLAVAYLRRWTRGRQVLDTPNERSSHSIPTPRGGGLAIVAVTLLGLGIWLLYSQPVLEASVLGYFLGAILIARISWLDDLHSLSTRVRFLAHGAAAVLAVWVFGYWGSIAVPVLGEIYLGWVGLLISLVWVIGLTNAYNFMDVIDGLAGGQAVVAGAGWALLGYLNGQPVVGVLGLLLAASSLGFLGHNWPPARIFMGDVGSAFLGFSFAVLPLAATLANPRFAVAGVLLLWPFLFDSSSAFVRRLWRRENVFAAHRTHLYQRLIISGFTHRTVTLIYLGLAIVDAILVILWSWGVSGSDYAVALLIPLQSVAVWLFVLRCERRRRAHMQPGDRATEEAVVNEAATAEDYLDRRQDPGEYTR